MGGSWNRGTPKSSILMVLSIINHPFWGTPILRNLHIYLNPLKFSLSKTLRHCDLLCQAVFKWKIIRETHGYISFNVSVPIRTCMCTCIYIYIHMNMSQTCNYVTSYNDHSTIYSYNNVVEIIGVNTSEYQRVAWQLFWDLIRCSDIIRIRSKKTSPHSECLLVCGWPTPLKNGVSSSVGARWHSQYI